MTITNANTYRNMYIYTCTNTQGYIAKEYGSSCFHLAVFFHCFSLNQSMALKYGRIMSVADMKCLETDKGRY